MKLWVVTGPIGAGKTLVAGMLCDRGARVIDADAAGHAVLDEPDVRDRLAAALGPVVGPDGAVDRAAVAALVFGDAGRLELLNSIVHPRLAERLRERLAALRAEEKPGQPILAVLEAAVYFQLPPVERPDLVISVVAGEQERLERLVSSGRMSEADARARIESQRPLLPRYYQADVILINDRGRRELERDIDALLARHPDILPPRPGRTGRRQ